MFAERGAAGWQSESFWSEEYLDWEDAYWDGLARLVVDELGRAHIAMRTVDYDPTFYVQRDENGAWQFEEPAWPRHGDIDLALGQDSEPRILTHDDASLVLSTREIIWLDKFSLLPITAR